jgi:hypothetical protein
MGDLLVSNGFPALLKADDDQMTMVERHLFHVDAAVS